MATQLTYPLQFIRQYAENLDGDYSFKTKAAMISYLTSARRYAGQIAYCEEDDKLYVMSKDTSKWNELKGNSSGIKIVDDYNKLDTTLTDYEINYCLNDYTDTTVTPNVTYSKGFYLFDKTSWNPLSVSGKIASNTVLGNVIIKKDGGIEVDSNGYIWINGYSVTTTTDPGTGEVTTTIINGGITRVEKKNPTTGETTTTTSIGEVKVEKKDDGSGNTTETTSLGGAEVKTETDPSGNTSTSIGGKVVSGTKTETATTTTTDPGTGNTITTTVTTTKTPNGTEQKTETTTTDVSTGDVTKVVETLKGGSDGVDVGSASGEKTTTVSDSTGTVTSTSTEDVTYTNGEEDQWLTQEEADKNMEDITSDLGWDM